MYSNSGQDFVVKLLHFFIWIVVATSSYAGPVEYVVKDIRDNPELRNRWNAEAQQVLYAVVDGIEYQIVPNDLNWNEAYIEIENIADLDGDGEPEAIVSTSHGGNCCGPNVFVVSHRGEGFFSAQTHEHLTGWPSVKIAEQYGDKLLSVENWSFDQQTNLKVEELSLFRFHYGKLELLSYSQNVGYVSSAVEITALDVEKQDVSLTFDINGDGIKEELLCSLWERWREVSCQGVYSGQNSNSPQKFQLSCSRIGFLQTKTNGYHDVVCNQKWIMRYDSVNQEYRMK